jgi:hypothetical protein
MTERICERCGGWRCPRCHQWNDDLPPTIQDGALTFCSSCLQLMVAEDGGLRLPTPEEWTAAHDDPVLWERISEAREARRSR